LVVTLLPGCSVAHCNRTRISGEPQLRVT